MWQHTWPVVPSDERGQANEAADEPDDGDGDADETACPPSCVFDRVVKCVVPVQVDHDKLINIHFFSGY